MSAHTLMIRKRCLYPSELYLIQADITHTDSHVLVHVHAQIKNARATCNAGFINYYQLLYINKPWHKSSDESATPNTLETLPRQAYYRPTGKIGRRGRWGATGDRDKEHRGGGETRKGNGERKRAN